MQPHTFHIPVLGLGYSIDTPLKVAHYGISSVLSVVDDELVERMRKYHANLHQKEFIPIAKKEEDSRAKRITAYLNLVDLLADEQFEALKKLPFEKGNDLCRFFELLPETSELKHGYELMMDFPDGHSKQIFQRVLKSRMQKGHIDVNIMAKVDKMNYVDGVYSGDQNTDALSALRGFALSRLSGSVVLSAGMNPRLYSYAETVQDFYPDAAGRMKKKIILKVSDFRSALIQAKFLAKKGLWVSEFRIESGLNCGGHAFATQGYLMGPILEEFKSRRAEMTGTLFELYAAAFKEKQFPAPECPLQRVTVQGGIGTAAENSFLLKHYELDATGWGSPFLLVPEVTNVDDQTLRQLAEAGEDNFYLSNASPLGIQFNNFRGSSIEKQRLERIEKGRAGSPCTKKYLCNNTEFTEEAICTASRSYQHQKIKELQTQLLSAEAYKEQFDAITEKICLCEGLCASAYLKYGINKPKESTAVAICPGPNLAYFSGIYSLDEMAGHIYGRMDLLDQVQRPHVFIKELDLYVEYLQGAITEHLKQVNEKRKKYLNDFKSQLKEGIDYYKNLFEKTTVQTTVQLQQWYTALSASEDKLNAMII